MSLNKLVEILERHKLPLGDVPQVRPRRQVDRRGEFRQQMLRQVKVEIESRQVTLRLLL